MSLMARVQRGRTPRPPRLLVYGTPGIGKSTFGSRAPKPVFVPTEDGLDEIDCAKFPTAGSIDEVLATIAELRTQEHEFETVVLDSLDWLERLIWDRVCTEFSVKNIEKADGGYARGYTHALTHWREVIDQLSLLRSQRGMVVVLIAHAKVEKFEDPEAPPYDRYSPRLHKHASALVSGATRCCLPHGSFAPRAKTQGSAASGPSRMRSAGTAASACCGVSADQASLPRTDTD